jgi:aldehyde dehydrogenase (NAD+)
MSKVAELLETMEYGPAPESSDWANQWLDSKDRLFTSFINGKFIPAGKAKKFDCISPSSNKKIASVVQSSEKDVDNAVKAAKSAQKEWLKLGGYGRAKHLYAIARLIQKHARLFAVLESLDNGKTIRETRDIDIPLVIRHFYSHAGWAQQMNSEIQGFKPYGVAGQIIPWNFPLLMLAWKVAPALATGNTVVLKAAEQTNLSAQLFADICVEAGLPKGVFNLITGDGEVGAMIVDHKGIDKIAFTGSTEIGRLIRKNTAGSGKGLTLELGGKSPFIVFDDADLDSAVEGLVDAIWFNQGEVCCAGSRLLVQESIFEKFIKKVKRRMNNLRVGDPLDKSIDVGAVVDKTQLKRISSLVKQAKEDGADIFQISDACPTNGCYFPPTLITNVEPSDFIVQEEIFGPVLTALSFKNQKEAIEIANNTRYGLAASVWSENINMALELVPKIKAGVVWVNSTNRFDASCGFGGYRESGYGREGGHEGLFAYLKPVIENDYETIKTIAKPKMKAANTDNVTAIDQTAKMYIAGKQARPDGNYSYPVISPSGLLIGEASEGNRKDIRNAVEAASKTAAKWSQTFNHNRAQIMYFIAENLSYRAKEFENRLISMTDCTASAAKKEVELSCERLFSYAGWCDKFEGRVHNPPMRGLTLAMNEPIGVIGVTCPEASPLLSFVSLLAPVIAMGNTTVIIPSTLFPLAATDFYQILETSDVPPGVVNIVTGDKQLLTKTLAEHDNVDSLWYFGSKEGSKFVEEASIGNLKQTWCTYGKLPTWTNSSQGEGTQFLRKAIQVKNIWVPYGE